MKLIFGCFIISTMIVLVLYIMSSKNIKNGFTRKIYQGDYIDDLKNIDLKYQGYYIAGYTPSRIYLGNYLTPLHILEINYNLDTTYLTPRMSENFKFRWKFARLSIDSPKVYITEGITPALFSGTLDSLIFTPIMKNSAFFTTFLPIASSSAILKSVKPNPRETILLKQTEQPPYIKEAPGVLKKQIDGLFCTDGILNYDRASSKIVYLYHYRNKFICMDTNLVVKYEGKTIDTTSRAKIKVATIASEGKVTLSSPPSIVNKKSCVYNNQLFVQSGLIADNESKNEIGQKAVIDTYSLSDGKYLFSFYIPAYDEQKLNNFQVVNNLIIAVYDHHLSIYRLNTEFSRRLLK